MPEHRGLGELDSTTAIEILRALGARSQDDRRGVEFGLNPQAACCSRWLELTWDQATIPPLRAGKNGRRSGRDDSRATALGPWGS
jgi:hypothetical protein